MKQVEYMKSFKVGAVVLATEQGLGYLAKDFFDNGIVDYVHIVKHSTRVNHYEWYPHNLSEEELLNKSDILLFFETPFNWKLIPRARELGKKTILMPMYECTHYPFPYEPDDVWCPSLLDLDYFKDKNSKLVQIPVNVEWNLRETAKVFVHNAGNGGLGGRNGTKELLQAMDYVKSPIKLIVRSQVPIEQKKDDRIEYRIGTFSDIWSEGDVFIFPEKFNGLSLPLQEAFASGMLIMAGDRYPINTWLPKEPLIPVEKYTTEKIFQEFKVAQYNPQEIAKCIDAWYNKDITNYSLLGKKFNNENKWQTLKEKYINLM
jgi:hypothetical protein